MTIQTCTIDVEKTEWMKQILLRAMGKPKEREYRDFILGPGPGAVGDEPGFIISPGAVGDEPGDNRIVFTAMVNGNIVPLIVECCAFTNPFSPERPPLCCLELNSGHYRDAITSTAEGVTGALYELVKEYAEAREAEISE